MTSTLKKALYSGMRVASWAYLGLLLVWLTAFLLTGDRFVFIALVNYLAVYLFFPLPLVLFVALLCKQRELWIGFSLGAIAFLLLWGSLFMPNLKRLSPAEPTLTVMTYNVLAWHQFNEAVLKTIRAEEPEIVLLQELNRSLAQALETELGKEYPYQVLEPVDNPTGIGVISKYPIHPTGERLPLRWVGGPQVLELLWNGEKVKLVNFHMYPTTSLGPADVVKASIRLREAEAHLLADLAHRSGLAIMGGDANSAPLSESYRILTSELQDAWHPAGFGLGHTFPGSTIPGSDRPRLGSWYVPPWLVRIDYVFHSADWVTLSARLARFDGVSDHRGVIAVLKLKD